MKLEKELGKDRILAQYLNTVYFGHGAYGIQAAAETYFGKPANELTVLESATLAGVLHAPDLYDPIDRPYDNRFRRDYALDQMVRYGYLDAATDGEAEGDALLRHGEGREQRDDRRARPGRVLRGLHAPDPRRTLRRGEGLRRRPARHDLARPRHATRRRAGDRARGCRTRSTIPPPRSWRWIRPPGRSSRWSAAGTGRRTRSTTRRGRAARAVNRGRRSRPSRWPPRCRPATT